MEMVNIVNVSNPIHLPNLLTILFHLRTLSVNSSSYFTADGGIVESVYALYTMTIPAHLCSSLICSKAEEVSDFKTKTEEC